MLSLTWERYRYCVARSVSTPDYHSANSSAQQHLLSLKANYLNFVFGSFNSQIEISKTWAGVSNQPCLLLLPQINGELVKLLASSAAWLIIVSCICTKCYPKRCSSSVKRFFFLDNVFLIMLTAARSRLLKQPIEFHLNFQASPSCVFSVHRASAWQGESTERELMNLHCLPAAIIREQWVKLPTSVVCCRVNNSWLQAPPLAGLNKHLNSNFFGRGKNKMEQECRRKLI